MAFSPDTRRTIEQVAREQDIEPAKLLAVVEVESGGQAYAIVSGRPEPLIRFEGHYFHRRLSGDKLKRAVAAGLASPKAGGVANPKTQAARWDLLQRAAAIDHKAAHESCSIGVGQVMGAHWNWLGYADVDAMWAEARSGVAGQVRLMVRFIEKSGLVVALHRRDWHAFARGYNGPQYKAGNYHVKLANAYAKWAKAKKLPAAPEPVAPEPVKPVTPDVPPAPPPPPVRPPVTPTLPIPGTPEPAKGKRGLWASLVALAGLGAGGALTQAETDQLAAWAILGGLGVFLVIVIVIWWRGRK